MRKLLLELPGVGVAISRVGEVLIFLVRFCKVNKGENGKAKEYSKCIKGAWVERGDRVGVACVVHALTWMLECVFTHW